MVMSMAVVGNDAMESHANNRKRGEVRELTVKVGGELRGAGVDRRGTGDGKTATAE